MVISYKVILFIQKKRLNNIDSSYVLKNPSTKETAGQETDNESKAYDFQNTEDGDLDKTGRC